MSEEPTQSATSSLALALAAVGGFLAAVGVFLPWASTTGIRTTEIFGEEVLGTHSANGVGEPTGVIVLVLGLAVGVVGVVALVLRGEGLRRTASMLALAGGIVILVACAIAALRPEELAGDLPPELQGERISTETSIAAGLLVSAGGGVIAAIGGLVARRAPTPAPAPAGP